MSGICGSLSLKGRNIEVGEIDALLLPLKQRGPDASRSWHEGPIGLGHTLLATTPESLVEVLPFKHSETGCAITADARLDNREELIAALGFGQQGRVVGDGELILHAYLKWGDDCPLRLLGDFAFAIWDPKRQQAFCARDHMGMRQLVYFHKAGETFVFASQPSVVALHQSVPRVINEERVIDYLEDIEPADLTSTFFQNVYRLPPAHRLVVSPETFKVTQYWWPEQVQQLDLKSDDEYAEAFLSVLREAITSRLRSTGKLGAMLSGGIDSGSVCAIASQLLSRNGAGPLLTVSAVGPDPKGCSETHSAIAMSKLPGIEPRFVDHSRLAHLRDDLMFLNRTAEEPFDHMALIQAIYLTAKSEGVNVMLDGVGADNILASEKVVRKYVREGSIGAAIREARGWQRFSQGANPAWKNLLWSFGQVHAPEWVKNARRQLFAPYEARRRASASLLTREYAEANGRERRIQAYDDLTYNSAGILSERAFNISHPHLVVGRERYERVAAQLGIEPRDPYCDLRLRKFALSLPAEQLHRNGWPKFILRHSMQGTLPEHIIWKTGRAHLGLDFTRVFHTSIEADVSRNGRQDLLGGRVAPCWLSPLGGKATAREDVVHQQTLWYLKLWIERHFTGQDR